MTVFGRRAFLGMSVGAVSMLRHPLSAAAQTPACVPGGMAQFLPQRLNVDCASRRNFQLFRKNADDLARCQSICDAAYGSMYLLPPTPVYEYRPLKLRKPTEDWPACNFVLRNKDNG